MNMNGQLNLLINSIINLLHNTLFITAQQRLIIMYCIHAQYLNISKFKEPFDTVIYLHLVPTAHNMKKKKKMIMRSACTYHIHIPASFHCITNCHFFPSLYIHASSTLGAHHISETIILVFLSSHAKTM